jgi:AcrR family transcriptional regulator
MARPREYDRDAVIEAAKDVFWRRGYEAAGLDVLEEATQLSRSSMYLAFGSKRRLFDEAMAEYRATFIESVLGPVEAEGSTAEDAARFFITIASLFRGELGSRGCLMINTIGELAGRDGSVARQGAEFHERYRLAFANALRGGARRGAREQRLAGDRALLLAGSAMGVWIISRVDPAAAARTCDAVVDQIRAWVPPPPRRATRS